MNISKISKLVLTIFLLLSVKCICEEGSLTNKQIIASIKEEVNRIQIPTYKKALINRIRNIKTEGLEVKLVKTTSSNLENDLIKAGLSEDETSIMKGIIFASKLSYKSFNFEIKKSFNNYDLKLSQFVGFAQKQNDSIEVAFVDVVVTATLEFKLYPKRLVYDKSGRPHKMFVGPSIVRLPPPNVDEIYSITNILKEHAKNELMKLN